MKGIVSTFRFIVFSHIFIGGCVFCFTAKTALILFGNNGSIHANMLAFFSTIFLYGFHDLYYARQHKVENNGNNKETASEIKIRKMRVILTIAAFGLSLSQLFYMPLRVWLILIPVAVLAFGYCIPFIKNGKRLLRLRDISWFKVLWIAFSYAWLSTFLPATFMLPVKELFHPQVIFIFLRNFLFVFAITIPFDIRDMKTDLKSGLQTLPLLLGIKGSIWVALLLLFAFLATAIFQVCAHRLPHSIFLALAISALEAGLVIPFSTPRKPTLFFPIAIEGSMLVQWVLLYGFLFIKI